MMLLGILLVGAGVIAFSFTLGKCFEFADRLTASRIRITVMPPTKDEQILLDMEWQLLLMGDES